MKKKVIIVLCILMILLSLVAVGCSNSDGAGKGGVDKAHSYSWWIPIGEDSSYYTSYNDNPGVQYILTKSYKDENGKDTKINIDFQVPATGSAKENMTTLISTGDYTDIMNVAMYSGSVIDLYEQGIALDITSYVEKYMPNYLKYLDANPEYKKTATNLVNGEKKYLQLYSYDNQLKDQWGGFLYRRDWIVKYGKNPADGSAFSGEYTVKNDDGTYDLNSWKDNVVFPSGGSDPIYISDWEWMLGIFQTALKEEGITDGYCMSLPYQGYFGTGDLVCAFGGGGPSWYKNKEDKFVNGLASDDFRIYLQCMNTWYKKGWIDTAFPEHATDIFYQIDDATVRQGKVGLWYGLSSQLIGKGDLGEGFSKGMIAYAARPPINDIYGTDAQKNKEPYTFYQQSMEGSPIIITDKASEKDMVALFNMLDYQFSDEVMLLHSMGLNKEQYEATQNEMYTKYGLTEGAYTDTVNAEGIHEVEYVDVIKTNSELEGPARLLRPFGINGMPDGYKQVNHSETEAFRHSLNEWVALTNTGFILESFRSQLNPEDAAILSKTQTNIDEFASKSIPNFIQGTKDPSNDEDWNAFLKAMNKYNPDKVTQIYNKLVDQLKK